MGTSRDRLSEERPRQKRNVETEVKDTSRAKGRRSKARERMIQASLKDLREDVRESRKAGDTKDGAGNAPKSVRSRKNVDGESLVTGGADPCTG